ncbi:uncharacterized protein N7443_004389 [Penicillium atrosanguineum]|uniref:uncharacterized protein n=1 Tax=Penicillium atrosanguineum TaxID=1132637 RepID=UPI0023A22D25|nr:uncharacterized protein N7443_004389 [Penicillium atrosanguineum]KAJ5133987.1 hypothetical protein N7526_005352 [Penicillium atrosanguineum]KAJ5304729.1 hypothetical protein N7443_004389 [Penicillium atrosanguineum]
MLGFLKRLLGGARNDVYGLDHAVLNVRLPPQTMWMNMGYWESTAEFPEACQALLDQVLAAGLLEDKSPSIRVLDVGCGCGDQSLHLLGLKKGASNKAQSELTTALRQRSGPESRQDSSPLIDTYIGITLEPAQAELAQSRVHNARPDVEKSSARTSAEVFRADASDPSSWPAELLGSIADLAASSEDDDTSTWLLALDTMYHFRPSRLPLLQYAHDTLHASFMAFDLVLSEGTSWQQRLILRLVCWLTGSPFSNFITEEDYIPMLVNAGYDPSRISIRDVSRQVFPGISGFLNRRVKEAQPFGMKMGKFRAAGIVFGWWAKSGVVRGVVVVARR